MRSLQKPPVRRWVHARHASSFLQCTKTEHEPSLLLAQRRVDGRLTPRIRTWVTVLSAFGAVNCFRPRAEQPTGYSITSILCLCSLPAAPRHLAGKHTSKISAARASDWSPAPPGTACIQGCTKIRRALCIYTCLTADISRGNVRTRQCCKSTVHAHAHVHRIRQTQVTFSSVCVCVCVCVHMRVHRVQEDCNNELQACICDLTSALLPVHECMHA